VQHRGPDADGVMDPRTHTGPLLVDLAHAGGSHDPEGVEPPVGEDVPDALGGGLDDTLDGGHVLESTRASSRHTPRSAVARKATSPGRLTGAGGSGDPDGTRTRGLRRDRAAR